MTVCRSHRNNDSGHATADNNNNVNDRGTIGGSNNGGSEFEAESPSLIVQLRETTQTASERIYDRTLRPYVFCL